jgi:hypothetical protein
MLSSKLRKDAQLPMPLPAPLLLLLRCLMTIFCSFSGERRAESCSFSLSQFIATFCVSVRPGSPADLVFAAGHAMHPGPGEGARQAFEDAHQLCLALE